MDKTRRRPDYDAEVARTDFLVRSYLGGESYDAALYLDKYPREKAAVFAARKERAYYLNFVAAVVDAYAAEVFRLDPSREVGGSESAVSAFVEDATGSGVGLTGFVRDAAVAALLSGRAYVGVDLDPEADQSPYAYAIHPANLLDYGADRRGNMLWALVAEQEVEESDPFIKRETRERFRLWLPDEWVLFDGRGPVVDSGPNVAGRVPIEVLDASGLRMPIYDIARVCRRIFNNCSQIDEILVQQTFSQLYLQMGEGVDEDGSSPGLTVGTGTVLDLPDSATITPGYVAPPDGPVKMHMEERERLINAAYSLAGLERKDPDAQKVQSGVAKSYDFRETNARMGALANLAEDAETAIFDLLADYGVCGPANVTYPKDFDVRAFGDQLESYLLLTEANLPAVVKRRAAMDLSLRLVEEGTEEEKNEVKEAVNGMDDVAFGGNVPPTRIGGGPLGGLDLGGDENGSSEQAPANRS